MGAAGSRETEAAAWEFVDRVTTEHSVTVFSKTYCPYCNMVRRLVLKIQTCNECDLSHADYYFLNVIYKYHYFIYLVVENNVTMYDHRPRAC